MHAAALLLAITAPAGHAGSATLSDPLVDRLVDQLENSRSACHDVAPDHPRRLLIEADIERFRAAVPVPEGVSFDVADCRMDGFVIEGRTVVLSVRMARLNEAQRFFIMAHEIGHVRLAHRAAMSSFVASVVRSTGDDESAARAGIESGLSAVSHQAEFEADAYAVRSMRAAGLDPEQAARLFDSLGDRGDNRTHPGAARRAKAIRELP